jgi:hypothetical protein
MLRKLTSARSLSALALMGALVTVATGVWAQGGGIKLGGSAKAGTSGASADAKSSTQTATTSAKPAATQTPRDPNGVTGISPFWEAINQGDAAFLAQDYAAASSQYQSAITNSPKNPVGHLRMAELSLKQGELDRAAEFVTAALRFSSDIRHKAHASFLQAEVQERKAMHDDAVKAWTEYKIIDGQLPAQTKVAGKGPLPPVVYVETAHKRISAIEAKKKLDEEYAAVRERIQKNIDAADEATGGGKKSAETTAETK